MKTDKEQSIKSGRANRLMNHLVFIITSFLFYIFYFGYKSEDLGITALFSMTLLPATFSISYFVNNFLLPRYFITENYGKFIQYLVYTFIISLYIIVLSFTVAFIFIADLSLSNLTPLSKDLIFVIIAVYLSVISNSVIKLLKYNYEVSAKNQILNNKMMETELNFKTQELQYLKNQINPHFLFNTLNTLYGLSLQQSTHTSDMIIQLSTILDYALYRSESNFVTAASEINHIKSYMALEKARLRENVIISTDIQDIPENIVIPPMILIPFVENCFKHGNSIDKVLQIDMSISIDSHAFVFKLKNSKKTGNPNKQESGIGISNTRKRLQLLYDNSFQLETSDNGDSFLVQLEIDINKIKTNNDSNEKN